MLLTLRTFISEIEQLERDREWYKSQYEEAVKVIAQLHRGYALPGEPTYIHPADFGELLSKSIMTLNVFKSVDNSGSFTLAETG